MLICGTVPAYGDRLSRRTRPPRTDNISAPAKQSHDKLHRPHETRPNVQFLPSRNVVLEFVITSHPGWRDLPTLLTLHSILCGTNCRRRIAGTKNMWNSRVRRSTVLTFDLRWQSRSRVPGAVSCGWAATWLERLVGGYRRRHGLSRYGGRISLKKRCRGRRFKRP